MKKNIIVIDKLEIINRLGRLTLIIHKGLRELGLDKNISRAVEVIPDTQQRIDISPK
ncbi:MAG: hypothetical protein AB8W37_09580 [Arsenophonus endosymbiont of Dermacentor nuttalli]